MSVPMLCNQCAHDMTSWNMYRACIRLSTVCEGLTVAVEHDGSLQDMVQVLQAVLIL